MNLLHQQIQHRQYGVGEIVEQTGRSVAVRFSGSGETRKFLYPVAFSSYLTLCDSAARAEMEQELLRSAEAADAERSRRMTEETRRIEEERSRLIEQRRAALRKRLAARRKRPAPAKAAAEHAAPKA